MTESATPFPKGAKVRLTMSRMYGGIFIGAGTLGEYVGPDLSDARYERVVFGGVVVPGVHVSHLERA